MEHRRDTLGHSISDVHWELQWNCTRFGSPWIFCSILQNPNPFPIRFNSIPTTTMSWYGELWSPMPGMGSVGAWPETPGWTVGPAIPQPLAIPIKEQSPPKTIRVRMEDGEIREWTVPDSAKVEVIPSRIEPDWLPILADTPDTVDEIVTPYYDPEPIAAEPEPESDSESESEEEFWTEQEIVEMERRRVEDERMAREKRNAKRRERWAEKQREKSKASPQRGSSTDKCKEQSMDLGETVEMPEEVIDRVGEVTWDDLHLKTMLREKSGKMSRSELDREYGKLVRDTICKYDYLECLVLLETKVDVSPKVWMRYSLEQLQQLLIRLWSRTVPAMSVPIHLAAAYNGSRGGSTSAHCALVALQYKSQRMNQRWSAADCETLAGKLLRRVNSGMQNGTGMTPNLPPRPLVQFRRKPTNGQRMGWTREELVGRWKTDKREADKLDKPGKMTAALESIQDRLEKTKRALEVRRSRAAVRKMVAAQQEEDSSSSSETDYSSDSNSEMDGMALPQPVNKRVTSIPQLKRKAMAREDPEDQRVFRMEENGRRYKQPRL